MSDFENTYVILGSSNVSPTERELLNVIGYLEKHCDIVSNSQPREDDSQENGFGHYVHENEFNMRLSQEMDSMMSMMHSQMIRAISTPIAERVIPEIQNIVGSMSSSMKPRH